MIDFHPHGFTLPRHTIDGIEQDFYETATLQDNLDHSGGITVVWKSKTDEEIPLGAYITYKGIRYVLIDQYAPSKESPFHFKYEVMFRHPQNMLDRIPFWIKTKDSSGGDLVLRTSSITGFPHTIAQKLVDHFADYANETGDTFFAETIGLQLEDDSAAWDAETNPWVTTWGINIPTTNDSAIITVPFDKSSLKSLANGIADAMGCNVFWNWNTKTIEFIAGTTIQGEAYNCFHVLGGTTNMGKVTASGGYAAITQRLALEEPVEGQDVFYVTDRYGKQRRYKILKGSIISGAAEGEMMLTKDLIFDDIYPKMELYIKTSRQRLCYLTDENGDFIVDQMKYYYMNGDVKVYAELAYKTDGKDYDAEGRELTEEPTFKMFSKWYVSLAYDRELTQDYVFDQSKLIDDKPLSMLFQVDFEHAENMSKLVGRQFELTYIPEDKKEWDKTDTVAREHAFEAHKGEFRIAFVAEGEVLLPSVGDWTIDEETHEGYWAGLCPNAGDKVTLVNMALTDEVTIAKENLLNAAKEIIGLMNAPAGEYTEQLVFKNPSDMVSVGDPSPFNTPGRIQHGPVVTSISHNLDTDIAEVTAGAWSRKTKTGGTADKLEVVTVSASSATVGGDRYSDGVIGDGSYGGTKQTEIETLNQTQLKPDPAYTAALSNTQSVLNCDEDGKVVAGASGVNLYTKIGAYYGTRDVTDTSSVTLNNALIGGVTVWLQASNTGADTTKQLRPNAAEALGDGDRYWLRINVPNGYDLSEPLSISFSINQMAYDSRVLTYEISGVRTSGGGSSDGRFQSRVFTRTNADLRGVTVEGGSYIDPLPYPRTQTYTISGRQVSVTWEDGIPQGSDILWSTIRWFYPDLTTDSWRTPAAETDTQTQDIEFAFAQEGDAQPPVPDSTNRHGGSGTQIWFDPVLDAQLPSGTWSDMVWRAEQKIKNGEAVGEWAITRIKGENGLSVQSYIYTEEAWSNDVSTASASTSPATDPSAAAGQPGSAGHPKDSDWSDTTPTNTHNYSYLWRRSRKMTLKADMSGYDAGQWSYQRLSGTNGTSIEIKDSLASVVIHNGTFPTTGMTNGDLGVKQGSNKIWKYNNGWAVTSVSASDGDSYTIVKDCNVDLNNGSNPENIKGHLLMWSDEAHSADNTKGWIDLGQFKGESGKTYFTHIAWAKGIILATNERPATTDRTTGQRTAPNAVATMTDDERANFDFSISPQDDLDWMGTLIDEESNDTSGTDAYKYYTWKYVKGADGTSSWVADLNNEMDSVSCDDTGYVLMPANQTTVSVSTVINLHYGSTPKKFKITAITRNNAAIAANSGVTVSPDASTTQRDSGLVFTVTYGVIAEGTDAGKTAKISGKDDFAITIQSVDETFTRTLHFIVNGIIGDVYNLKPSVDEIHAERDGSGNYVVNGYPTYMLTCGYTKNVKGTITEYPDTNGTTITGKIDSKYNIYHRRHNRAENTWGNYYLYTGNKSQVTVLNLNIYDAVEFILCTNATNTTTAPVGVIDRETVYVIADGEVGPDGIRSTVSPDKITIPCNEQGGVIAQVQQALTFAVNKGTISSVSEPSSLPTGVTITGTTSKTITIGTTASDSDLSGGIVFTVSGTDNNNESFTTTCTLALICSRKGTQGNGNAITLIRNNYTETQWNDYADLDGEAEDYSHVSGDPDFTLCRIGDIFTVSGTATDTHIKHTAEYQCTAVSSSMIWGICISHITDGANGQPGTTGHIGRWYEFYGEYASDYQGSDAISNTDDHGWFIKKGAYFYMLIADTGEPKRIEDCPTGTTGNDDWEYMGGDRKYYIAEAMFADEAYFGSFVINHDWMISKQGGPSGKTYSDFVPSDFADWVSGRTSSYSGFVPNFAVDGATGTTYQNVAHVRGEINAESGTIGGFKIGTTLDAMDGNTSVIKLDGGNKRILVGNIELTANQTQGQAYKWSGMAYTGGRDVATIGMRNYSDTSYAGHIWLGGQGTEPGFLQMLCGYNGSTSQSKLQMGPSLTKPCVELDGMESLSGGIKSGKVTVRECGSTNTDRVILDVKNDGVESKGTVTADDIKADKLIARTSNVPIAFPDNLFEGTQYSLPSSPVNGQWIIIKATFGNSCIVRANGHPISESLRQNNEVDGTGSITIEATSLFIYSSTGQRWLWLRSS